MLSRRALIAAVGASGLTLLPGQSYASTIHQPFSLGLNWSNMGILPMLFGGFHLGGTYDFSFTMHPTNSALENPPYRCDLYLGLSTPQGWASWVEPQDVSADFMALTGGLFPARTNFDLDYSAQRTSEQILGRRTRVRIPDNDGYLGLCMLVCACVDPGKDPQDTDNWFQSAIKAFTVRPKGYRRG